MQQASVGKMGPSMLTEVARPQRIFSVFLQLGHPLGGHDVGGEWPGMGWTVEGLGRLGSMAHLIRADDKTGISMASEIREKHWF